MSQLEVDKIIPQSGTTLTIGETGDTISFASGVLPALESLTITGDLTVDTTTLKVDSTNNRVGIGTASPSYDLQISKDGGGASVRLDVVNTGVAANDDTLLSFLSGSNNNENIIFFGDTDDTNVGIIRYNHASDYMSFTTNASEAMRIDSSGNVGIGTTSPSLKLEINSGTGNVPLGLTSTDAACYISLRDDTTGGAHGNATVALGAIGDELVLRSNQAERMRIDSSGRVGIGTNNPSQKLEVVGTIKVTNTVNASNNSNLRDGGGLVIEAGNSNPMYFYTGGSEQMRITSAGNVGIGVTSPIAKLQVDGRAHIGTNTNGSEASPYLSLDGSGYTGFHWMDGSAYYIGQNSNSRSLRLYSGSNEAAGAQLSAGGTSFGTYSDERLKKDITDLTNGLDKIVTMRPVNFKYKFDEEGFRNRIGIVAQSIVGQVDEALDETQLNETDTTLYYNVRYQDLIPVLVKAIQELKADNDALRTRIEALENA